MLRRAGVDTGEAAAAFTASTGLQIATAAALPVFALPAIVLGAPVSRGLATAAYLGRRRALVARRGRYGGLCDR
jgi:hypothetical protein